MKKELSAKVLALYRAVCTLVDEGCDINSLTVSQITEKAGIGKGTAYEYFKSKEEIIVRALIYDFRIKAGEIRDRICQVPSFREKVMVILDWLELNFSANKSFMQLIKIGTQSFEIKAALKAECQNGLDNDGRELMEGIVNEMINSGIKEGLIDASANRYYASASLTSQIVQFAVYLSSMDTVEGVTVQDAKDYALACVLKTL